MINSKRQKIRRAFLFAGVLLFPVTIFYFSPYLPLTGAAQGIMNGSLFVFLGMFVVSMVSGRFFCGWLCPVGAIQEFAGEIRTKRVNRKKTGWIKFLIWIPWIILIAYVTLKAGGFRKADFFYQTDHGISVSSIYAYIIYYGVIFLFLAAAVIAGRRGGCHSLCWMAPFMIGGKKIGSLLTIPRLYIKKKNDNCSECGLCTRRCPMSIDVMQELKAGTLGDQTDCILCGECADSCPKQTIGFGFGRSVQR